MPYCRKCGSKMDDNDFMCLECESLTKEQELELNGYPDKKGKALNYQGFRWAVSSSAGRGVSFALPEGYVRNLRKSIIAELDTYNLGYLFIIFDGGAGKISGDMASFKAAMDFWTEYYSNSKVVDIEARIQEVISKVNTNLYEKYKGRVSYGEVGTSISGIVIKNNQVHCFSLGDSRCYLVKDNKIELITQDDVEEDRRTEIDLARNKKMHPITKGLGFSPTAELHIYPPFTLNTQSKILLTSAGIHNVLTAEHIQELVVQNASLKELADKLRQETTKINTKTDFISILIDRNPEVDSSETVSDHCPYCGNEIDTSDVYCTYCGNAHEFKINSPSLAEKKIKNRKEFEASRYHRIDRIGEGSRGLVLKVKDFKDDGSIKALKILNIDQLQDESLSFELELEAEKMANIDHPFVAKFWDIHFLDDITFLEQEYVPGESLAKISENTANKRISERRVWQLASQISAGMQAIHRADLLHLNLKAENILQTKLGDIKIADYAITELLKKIIPNSQELLIYASPEQLAGKDIGKPADVWSFGALLYHLLSGKTLYSATSNDDLLQQIKKQQFAPLSELSDSMNALLAKCLNYSPEARFSNFTEVSEFIDNALKLLPKLEISEDIFINSVLVEGGSFQMGSENGKDNEKPLHKVTVSDFYIGKYQVTQAEWMEIMGENHSLYKKENNPVEKVNWYDAVEYCNKKSIKDGLDPVYSASGKEIKCDFSKVGYRLPTEAEWEYAAKGGKLSNGYKYSGSDKCYEVALTWDYHVDFPNPVGINAPNELGIYDMSGNVCEWCWDYFNKYSAEEVTNPLGPILGDERVIRGGSWGSSESSCCVSYREFREPNKRNCEIGLRIIINAK